MFPEASTGAGYSAFTSTRQNYKRSLSPPPLATAWPLLFPVLVNVTDDQRFSNGSSVILKLLALLPLSPPHSSFTES